MQYISYYQSPAGRILLAADDEGLIGLWFKDQRFFARNLEAEYKEVQTPVLKLAAEWLDLYFSGIEPEFSVPFHFSGTPFQNEVWKILCTIPYGKTMTYGEIAAQIAAKRGIRRMSAQAVGNAVGRNDLSIFVPCHRVIGADGKLTGYSGGLDKKAWLLRLEKIDLKNLHNPKEFAKEETNVKTRYQARSD